MTDQNTALVILTEGSQTEPAYFKALVAHANRSDVDVLAGKSSDPLRLLNEAIQIKKSQSCEAWIVLDTEVSGKDRVRDRRLTKAIEGGKRYGIHIALAQPCFEAWLLSHFDGEKNYNFNQSSKFYSDLLTRKLGKLYRKNEYDVSQFVTSESLQTARRAPTGENGLSALIERVLET